MNAIAPVWDGNETWLVLGGGGLLGRLSARLCDRPSGALRAADRDAARAGLSRRRLRVSLARSRPSPLLGRRLLPRLAGRDLRAGRDAGRAAAGDHDRGPRLCRRLVGMAERLLSLLTGASLVVAYALLGATWLIWKTEGRLHDDARRFATWLLPAFLLVRRRGQPRDAVPRGAILSALVRLAGRAAQRHHAARLRRRRADRLGRDQARPRLAALRRRSGPVRADPGRPRHLDLARRHSGPGHDLAGGRALREPALHAGRRRWS